MHGHVAILLLFKYLMDIQVYKYLLVMQRHWFLEFDTISIRYCQNIAISIDGFVTYKKK